MNSHLRAAIGLLTFCAGLFAQAPAAAPAAIEPGDYLGALEVGAMKLRLALHLKRSPEGVWTGTMDSLDQGAMGLPTQVTVIGSELHLGTGFGAVFDGKLEKPGEISGRFKQGPVDTALVFRKVDKIEMPKRPQEPARPLPYNEREVEVVNGSVRLAGTLTTPKGDGPFTAALLLTGSGPQDRDESLFGHKPFLVLSDHLTRQGFAVLRLDDRGAGKSTGVLATSTYDDFTADAEAAVRFLRAQKEIHPKRVGIMGHSEGAAIAQIVASRDPELGFIVLMAGPGVAGDQLLYEQGQLVAKSMKGVTPQLLARQLRVQQVFLEVIKNEKDNAQLPAKIRESIAKFKAELPEAERAAASTPEMERQMESELRRALQPPMISLVRHDPAVFLKKVACPVLAINGVSDVQVAHYQNLPAISAALAKNEHPDYTVSALPKLNHLFQTAKTGTITEYGELEETMSPLALETISRWLALRFPKN